MDWKEVTGIVTGVFIVGVPAAKWLINSWAKKAQELDELKAATSTRQLNRLEDDVKEFRTAIDGLQVTIRDLSTSLLVSKNDISNLKERLDETKKMLTVHSENMTQNIRNLIKTEIVELSKNARLIRNKNGTGGS
jgi:predicted  nucleic acid-binding Zn-ribbon protein